MMLLCPCVACDEGGGPLNDVTETTSGEEGGRITRLFLFLFIVSPCISG